MARHPRIRARDQPNGATEVSLESQQQESPFCLFMGSLPGDAHVVYKNREAGEGRRESTDDRQDRVDLHAQFLHVGIFKSGGRVYLLNFGFRHFSIRARVFYVFRTLRMVP